MFPPFVYFVVRACLKTLRSGGHELAMQREPEAARLLHAEHLESLCPPLLDLLDELFACELPRGFQAGVILLAHRHDELQMHVESQLERGAGGGINDRRGQGLARRNRARHNRLVEGGRGG